MNYKNRDYGTRPCSICGTEFRLTNWVGKLCSSKCRAAHNRSYQIARRKNSVENSLRTIVAGCRSRAKKRQLDCDIDSNFVLWLLEKQQYKCAVTGLPLEATAGLTRHQTSPWTISIDRVDSNKRYTKDNIHLVCYIYNSAKNNWTHEDVLKMSEALSVCVT